MKYVVLLFLLCTVSWGQSLLYCNIGRWRPHSLGQAPVECVEPPDQLNPNLSETFDVLAVFKPADKGSEQRNSCDWMVKTLALDNESKESIDKFRECKVWTCEDTSSTLWQNIFGEWRCLKLGN